jgi:hypothetical protein
VARSGGHFDSSGRAVAYPATPGVGSYLTPKVFSIMGDASGLVPEVIHVTVNN